MSQSILPESSEPALKSSEATHQPSIPASVILRTQAKSTPISPLAVTTSLAESCDPFNGLFDQALASAARHQSTSTNASRSRQVSDPIKPTYADLKSIWRASGQFYGHIATSDGDRVETPARRIVSDDTANTSFGAAAFSTPIRIPLTPSTLGKADKSANWRNKPVTTPGGREIPSIAVTSPAIEANSTVMTIDALFDKFHVIDEKVRRARPESMLIASHPQPLSATPLIPPSRRPPLLR